MHLYRAVNVSILIYRWRTGSMGRLNGCLCLWAGLPGSWELNKRGFWDWERCPSLQSQWNHACLFRLYRDRQGKPWRCVTGVGVIEPCYFGTNPESIKRVLFPGLATNSVGTPSIPIQHCGVGHLADFQLCNLKNLSQVCTIVKETGACLLLWV